MSKNGSTHTRDYHQKTHDRALASVIHRQILSCLLTFFFRQSIVPPLFHQVCCPPSEVEWESCILTNPFLGRSRISLQDAFLKTLGDISNLRKESSHYRDRLRAVKEAIKLAKLELEQIEFAISQEKVVAFPEAIVPPEVPTVERVIGRWGKVTYEPIDQPFELPKIIKRRQ